MKLGIGLALSCALAVAGCADSPTTTSQGSTTTTTASASPASRPECEAVVDSARTLVDDLSGFLTGSVAANQLRTDADELVKALTAAKDVAAENAQEQWDQAKSSLEEAQAALAAQPVDLAGLRASVNEALPQLEQAVRACTPEAEPIPSYVPSPTTS